MSIAVEQVLHGYRRGHERLAGSIKLANADADLITRLSDLSGTLSASTLFEPYLTVYPLPSGSFYAIAQTWLDTQATRSGCVITHTLLVKPEAWRTALQPAGLVKLFLPPLDRSTYEPYERSLLWYDVLNKAEGAKNAVTGAHVNFTLNYFAEGKRPIVWFGNPDPIATFWQLVTGLWPALRERFATCTFCLRPRTLDDRPFDLMFAPFDMHARFLKLGADHVVDSANAAPISPGDAWCRHWAERLFGGAADTVTTRDLWAGLDDDPTAIRRVYLVDSALRTDDADPLAAVGAMDLVESVARSPDAAPNAKTEVALRAVSVAGGSVDVAKGLECLRLIEDRLRRNAYVFIAPQVGSALSRAVAGHTACNPELVAESSRDAPAISSEGDLSWYGHGLLDGFRHLAESSPTKLGSLRKLPAVAQRLFRIDPAVSVAYGGALFSQRKLPELQTAFREWLHSDMFVHVGPATRRALLPSVNARDVEILPELLRGVSESEVHEILASLQNTLADPGIERTLESTVVSEFPESTRAWLSRAPSWRQGFEALASATYPQTRQGLDELLSDTEMTGTRRCFVLASYLHRVGGDRRFPLWLCDAAHKDLCLIATLLDPGAIEHDEVDQVLAKLLSECEGIKLAHSSEIVQLLPAAKRRTCFHQVLDTTFNDLFRGYLSGTLTEAAAVALLEGEYGGDWIRTHPQSRLRGLLTHDIWKSTNWTNAWRILLISPTSFYQRHDDIISDVIDGLLRSYGQPWSPEVAMMWRNIIVRAENAGASAHIQLALCVQAVQFALGNPRLPVSAVLVGAFSNVYDAVVSRDVLPPETRTLFGLWDWDKGKELRRGLVDAFFSSNWPPGDLACAVESESLLRKIVKRIHRKYDGERYLHSMLADLRQRVVPEELRMHDLLASILHQPNYHEEWD